VATFEHAFKKLAGAKARTDGFVDLFWPGMLLVEQKSRGKNLDHALTQALAKPALHSLEEVKAMASALRSHVRSLTRR